MKLADVCFRSDPDASPRIQLFDMVASLELVATPGEGGSFVEQALAQRWDRIRRLFG